MKRLLDSDSDDEETAHKSKVGKVLDSDNEENEPGPSQEPEPDETVNVEAPAAQTQAVDDYDSDDGLNPCT